MRKNQMTRSWLSVFIFLACGDAACCQQASQISPSARVTRWLDKNVPTYMTESKMPGFSIAVVKDGKTIYEDGFGSRDPQRNLPATPNTLYGIGSITKSMVAIGIMQLVEEGKLGLRDPVSQYVPFQLGSKDHPITIHHLLTHTLGIPSLASSSVALYRGLGHDTGVPFSSAGDFYRFVNGAEHEIVTKPGDRFFYHNAAWRMLAHIIQEQAGMPFHTYLTEHVTRPLGMERTTLSVADFLADPDHIVPHHRKADGSHEAAPFPYPDPDDNPEFSFLAGAGGVISSVHEMTRYLVAQIEQGDYGTGRLASAASFKSMQQLHICTPVGYYGQQGYGYGLRVTSDFLGHTLVSHGGSIIVSTAHMAFVPELKAGVVMMGNSSGMPYATIAESILAILMEKDPAERVPAVKIKERMKQLTGNYEVYRGLEKVNVRTKDGMLYMEIQDRLGSPRTVPLIPEYPTLQSTSFYTLSNGIKSPVEFQMRDGNMGLFIGRYWYHKTH